MLMTRFTLFLLIALTAFSAHSQTLEEAIERLRIELKQANDDADKARLSGDLSYYFATLSADSSLKYAEESLTYSKAAKNDTLIAQALNDLATSQYLKGHYDEAIALCRKSYTIRKNINDAPGMASLYMKLGNNFYRTTQYDSSMFYYLKARDFYHEVGNTLQEKTIESNISTVYQSLGNYDRAIAYLESPIAYYEANEDFLRLSNNLINLANIQLAKGDTAAAINTYFRGETACQLGANYLGLGAVYNNLGETYFSLNEFNKAVDYISRSIELRKNNGYDADLSSSYLSLGSIYFREGKYSTAKPLLLEAAAGLETSETYDKLSQTYQQLTTIYAYERNTDSLNLFLTLANALNYEVVQREVRELTQDLEEKYQSAQKDKALLEQEQTIQSRELALQRQTIWLISVVGIAVILALVLYYLYRQKQAASRQAALERKLAKEQERSRIQEERLRISRELHDNIGSYLSLIKVSVEQLPELSEERVRENLPELQEALSLSMRELRKTVWLLNNDEISVDALAIRLREFFKPLGQSGVNVQVQVKGDGGHVLSDIQATHLFRILQEAINNAWRHGEAQTIAVVFNINDDRTVGFSVTDDGGGYNPAEVQRGNGLHNMKSRMAELQGHLEMQSEVGKGTTVRGRF
jgi:signal transduction histidine kinase